jgi:hypothetical protein
LADIRVLVGMSGPLFETSSLVETPVRTILEMLEIDGRGDLDDAAEVLRQIGALLLAQEEPSGFLVGRVANALCDIGHGNEALVLVDECWRREAIEGARAVLGATEPLYQQDPSKVLDWLERSWSFTDYTQHFIHINRELFTGKFAYGLAAVGKWEEALSLVASVRARERTRSIETCLHLAARAFVADLPALRKMVERLMELVADLEPEDRAKLYAVGAQILTPLDVTGARAYVNRASGACLAHLPEGDTDSLRQLLAAALHQQGDYLAAVATTRPMHWRHVAIQTYATLIAATGGDRTDVLQAYADDVLLQLQAAEDDVLFGDSLVAAMQAAWRLADALPEAARALVDYSFDAAARRNSVGSMAAAAAARTRFDPGTGWKELDHVLRIIEQRIVPGSYEGGFELPQLINQLGKVADSMPGEARPRLERAYRLIELSSSEETLLSLKCSYAAAVAPIDAGQATSILREQIQSFARWDTRPSQVLHLARMVSEFTGRRTGPRHRQVDAVRDVGNAIALIAKYDPFQAAALLRELLDAVRAIPSPPESAQALADFINSCGNGPAAVQPLLADVYDLALSRIQALPAADLIGHVVKHAVAAFCRVGDFARAEQAAALLDDRTAADLTIEGARGLADVGPLTLLQQVFIDVPGSELAEWIVIATQQREAKEALQFICESLGNETLVGERGRLLSHWVRLTIVPAHDIGGTELIAKIVMGAEDFDRRLQATGELIAEIAQPAGNHPRQITGTNVS